MGLVPSGPSRRGTMGGCQWGIGPFSRIGISRDIVRVYSLRLGVYANKLVSADTKKRFASVYSLSSLVHYEPYVDSCVDLFVQRLDEFAKSGKTFDLGHWFQCYAFDVIGNITFGERFGESFNFSPSMRSTLIGIGFLDHGHDIDGTMEAVQGFLKYGTLVGVYPQWHIRLSAIFAKLKLFGAGSRAYIHEFTAEKIALHEKKIADTDTQSETKTQDFVEKMMVARDKDPEKVTDHHIFIMAVTNVAAGSDTTGISLSAIMWHLLHFPETLQKLRDELDDFTASGRCSSPPSFKETQEMPYFQAVMKEALRMHPATGLPMWRTVPEGGAEIQGRFMAEGTVVGVNTWVAHYDESIFPDARTFRPERWIEAESTPEKLKEMNQMYMPVSTSYIIFRPWRVLMK